MKLLAILFSCLAILLCSSALFAGRGNRAKTANFTLGAGYDFFASRRHLENTSFPFIALGYNFTDCWGIEGFLGSFTTNFKASSPNPDDREVRGTLFAVDALFHWQPHQTFDPYVFGGLGVLGLNPNGNDANNAANINFGAGLAIFASSAVAFRLDARDFYTMIGGKNDVFLDFGVNFYLDVA